MSRRVKRLLCTVLILLLCAVFPVLALAEDDISSSESTVSESETVTDPAETEDPDETDEVTSGLLSEIKEALGDMINSLKYLDPANWLDAFRSWAISQSISATLSLTSYLSSILGQNFFANGYIRELLSFFKWMAGIILGVAVIKTLAQSAHRLRQGGISRLTDMIFDIIKAFCLVLFAQPAVIYLNYWTLWLINVLSAVPGDGFSISYGSISALGFHTIVNVIICIVLLVCTIKIIWTALKRYVILTLQIIIGYFYAFDVAGGDDQALGEWLRDVLSGCITFALQMIMYQVGLKLLCSGLNAGAGLNSDTLVGFIFLISVASVPSILRKWGSSYQKSPGHGGQIAGLTMQAAHMIAAVL